MTGEDSGVMHFRRGLFCFFLALLPLVSLAQQEQSEVAPPQPMGEEPMKAIRIHNFGGPEVLQLDDVERPEPASDEVRIRVIAAGVNPVDAAVRSGRFARMLGTKLPITPGLDVAGVVDRIGDGVTKFHLREEVYACLNIRRLGGYAQYAIAKESEVSLKPKNIGFEGAAAMPVAAGTAWQALVDTAKLSAGQTVLIHGGSGGVGSFAVQIAKARGAKVIATASGGNQQFLKELGADQTIDYNATKFEEVVKDVDVVLDSVAGETLRRSYGVVKKGGIIVSLLEPPDKAQLDARGIRGIAIMATPDTNMLGELTRLVEAKKLRPIVTKTFPLADAAKAQQEIETGHTRGKIVLRIADDPPKG